ncbi:DoxX family protein [Lacibacterium aquatile]|uniref:DoxX family protein n=1 Tax=Lacibacterium aquatile TaxID=1168082 RepID=A0ABW5DNI7_9PROT
MTDQRFVPYSALLLRVSLGILFLAHGFLLKVMTFTPAGTAKFFESLGYPAFFAYIVIIAEVGGGIALILGAYTRLVSLLFVPIMIGATMQHIGNGWGFGNQGGGWEFPVLWTALLFVQAGLGSGAYALKLPTFGKPVLA